MGEWKLFFRARDGSSSAPRLSFRVHVGRTAARAFVSDVNGRSQNATLLRSVNARANPSGSARIVARLSRVTPEEASRTWSTSSAGRSTERALLVARAATDSSQRLLGWIPRDAVDQFRSVDTHLVIDRARFRATLFRRGRPIFRSIVGVGEPHWPTPPGRFYVRERLTGFTDPIYGAIAFGTNGRSSVLTDWPGGGFIGIHGTNQPQILPGRVSHGCVRLPNVSIRRLDRLMRIGTPVTIK